jgi:phosphopantothenoylcysteine synthetase/decarboxylase
MASSRILVATRALVALLLVLARHYELVLEVNRDSSAELLVKAYTKVLLKAHPDQGASKEATQKLLSAKADWESARKASAAEGGRPSGTGCAGPA